MENLRRIIIPWTDNGYNFNFKTSDSVHTYVVIITNVVKNSPAEAAGLRVGDGVVSINGNLLRNLSKSEINSLINNFRNTALKLTVLQNFHNSDEPDKVVGGHCHAKDQRAGHTGHVGARQTGSHKYGGSNSLGAAHRDIINQTKRKFSKYSRNMSDVTHNSRFYIHRNWDERVNRRSTSPMKENGSVNHATGSDFSTNQLQLNRVGGIMRIPLPSNAITNNLFMTKPEKSDNRRKNQLTYLTCSPIPYRSGRILDSTVSQERRSLPEELVRESIYHHQISDENPETKVEQSEIKSTEEQDVPSGAAADSKHNINIDPLPVRIMWKFTNNSEVTNRVWQHCVISVENGLFRVKENEDGEVCEVSSPDEEPSENSKSIYNFRYFDCQQRKSEFLVEFFDQDASVKWMHFFDSPEQKEETHKNSKTHRSHILNPTTNVSPVAEIINASCTKLESATGKGKLHHALTRVRNFTQRRLNNNDPTSDFKRQQEEWLLKTEPHFVSENEDSKEMAVNICTDHLGYLGDKVHIPHLATLPLDKWQRSATSPFIPLVVEICVKVIEKFGIHHVGIYRVSGNKLSLDAINHELRRPLSELDISSDVWNDIYAISGVLKSFLRSLPDGVFPKDYYFEIIGAWKMYERDREKRLLSVQRLLNILESVPDHPEYRFHWETMKYLACHLHLVSSKSSINKMTAKNLAVVFAPTLIKPPTETNEILMSDFRHRIELVENIINHYEWMFSPGFESACNIPSEIDQENTLLTEMQFECFTDDQLEDDRISENQEDARVLIGEIIETVKTMSPNLPNTEVDNTQYTLIELNTNKEVRDRQLEASQKQSFEISRSSEEYSLDNSPEISETPSTKDKKPKRMSFKLPKSKHGKSNFPRDQLLLTNKKLCALSIALITSNRCPLNSTLIVENESPKIAVE